MPFRNEGGSPARCGKVSSRKNLPLTILEGWFDGWGPGNGPRTGNKGKSEGLGGRDGGSSKPSSKGNVPPPSSSSSRLTGGGGSTSGGKQFPSPSGGKERGVIGDKRIGKGERGDEGAAPLLQTLGEAVRESLKDAPVAIQERLSLASSSQNMTLVLGGGALANVTVPWRGIGVYVGGVLSGLAVAVGLLTVPYADIGSVELRKSLTLFENVLVDIDQVGKGRKIGAFRLG